MNTKGTGKLIYRKAKGSAFLAALFVYVVLMLFIGNLAVFFISMPLFLFVYVVLQMTMQCPSCQQSAYQYFNDPLFGVWSFVYRLFWVPQKCAHCDHEFD